MRKSKKLPEFKTEAEERAFWESHDSSDCVDWSQAEQTSFPRQLSGHPPQKPGNSGSRAIGLGDCVRGGANDTSGLHGIGKSRKLPGCQHYVNSIPARLLKDSE